MPATAVRKQDVHLRSGLRLRYAEHGPEVGPPLVCLHGYADSWFSFSRLLEELPNTRAYALDLRGHGGSDRPLRCYPIDDFAADVSDFLEECDLHDVLLVGHSMGSFIAQAVAVSAPERVRRVVLIGSSAETREEDVREMRDVLETFGDPVPSDFVRRFQESTVHRSLPERFFERVVEESCRVPVRVWRSALAGMLDHDPLPILERIEQPALVLWGEHDAYFGRSDQDALMQALRNAELEVFSGVGHAPHWEVPDEAARSIGRFVGASG